MEQEVIVLEEGTECEVDIELEPFSLSDTQSKIVPLDMVDGDQVVFPDSGFLLQSVRIQKPEDLEPDNIVDGKNIGGVPGSFKGKILPELSRPAESVNVFDGYEYIDQNGEKRTGRYHFPIMTNPAQENDVFSGKEYLGQDGQLKMGSFSYPSLSNPADTQKVFQGFEYIDQNGDRQTGSFSFSRSRLATAQDVVTDKRFWDANGNLQWGELEPNHWSMPYLHIFRTTVTVGPNSVNTTLGVRDYLVDAANTNVNRLLAFAIQSKESYQEGEIGRAVIYQNSSIGYFTVMQYLNGSWGTGRMLSGYSAVLLEGSIYDVIYWDI